MTLRNILRFWSKEHSLSALLAILIFDLFILMPTAGGWEVFGLAVSLIFWLILLAGIHSMARGRLTRTVFSALVVLTVIIRAMRVLFGLDFLAGWDFLFSTFSMAGMLIVILRMVYQDGPVTAHRIRGAVAAYLLLSALFAHIYAIINYYIPDAFTMPAALARESRESAQAFYYFSMVTLTTTGYGDITAVIPAARSLVMAEALIGQLYPAILLARLVSLSVAAKTKER